MAHPRHILVLLVPLLPLLAGGCAALSKTPAGAPTAGVRDGTLLDPDVPALRIEIDYVEGSEPRPRALRIYEQRMAFYCDKPGGIEVVVDDEIPAAEWEASKQTLVALARKYADERDSSRAYLYLLYAERYEKYRGYSYRSGTLHRDLDFPVCAIFTSQLEPILWLTGVRQEASVLVHETGHAFGLVTNDGHRDGGHCTNSWCLMYDGVDARSAFVHLFPTLFTGYLPTHFCADCRADLWGDQRVPGRRAIPGLPTPERPGCDPAWGDAGDEEGEDR